jgi:hypothetical protein
MLTMPQVKVPVPSLKSTCGGDADSAGGTDCGVYEEGRGSEIAPWSTLRLKCLQNFQVVRSSAVVSKAVTVSKSTKISCSYLSRKGVGHTFSMYVWTRSGDTRCQVSTN